MTDYKDKTLADFENEWKESRRSIFWGKVKNALNVLPQDTTKQNIPDGPDVSTITEHIAFVIDDQVVEIMHCQPKLAAILLSEPKIIKIPDNTFPKPGWSYKNDIFMPSEDEANASAMPSGQQEDDSLPTFKEYIQNPDAPKLPTFKEYIERLLENEKNIVQS